MKKTPPTVTDAASTTETAAKPAKKSARITAINTEPLKHSRTGIVSVPGVKTNQLKVLVIGETPLVVSAFSKKQRDKMLSKHLGEASAGREVKNPVENFLQSRYRTTTGRDGIPAGGVMACIIACFSKDTGVFASKAKGALRVKADDMVTNLVEIIGPSDTHDPHFANGGHAFDYPADDNGEAPPVWPRMREDVVRNATGVPDIRHRAEFWPWALLLTIDYLPNIMSDRQLTQAISLAGFKQGLCEWRPGSPESKSGTWGTFRLSTEAEIAAYEDGNLFASAPPRRKIAI
jgi:hypothetical protein